MERNNQAAMQTISADQTAVARPATGPATTRTADEIISSLKVAVATITPARLATTRPEDGNVSGTVTFTQVDTLLIVVADLSGLKPDSTHALEIHDTSDLSAPDLSSAGDRWQLADANSSTEPIGELGNVQADVGGRVYFERTLGRVSVGGQNDVIGHSVIVRALPTASGSEPVGDNARIAGGAIVRQMQ